MRYTKNKKYLSLPEHYFVEKLVFAFGFYRIKSRIKYEFATNFVEIIISIIF